MESLTSKLNAVQNEALLIIKNKLTECNGSFIWWDTESAYDEDTYEMDEDFVNKTFKFIANGQYDNNETVYLLAIKDNTPHNPTIESITETGEVIVTDLLEIGLYQLVELAEFIQDLPEVITFKN